MSRINSQVLHTFRRFECLSLSYTEICLFVKCSFYSMLYNCLVWSVKGHSTIVNAIDGIGGNTPNSQEGAPLIATGSRDGTVKVRKLFSLNTAVGK